MKLFAFALLATVACTHTYNDRELGSPPKHPFNFKPVPPATASASNDERPAPPSDTAPPTPNNSNSNRPADSDAAPTESQKPIRDARPDAFPPSGS